MSLPKKCRRSSDCEEECSSVHWDHYLKYFWRILSDNPSVRQFETNVNNLMDDLMKHGCEDPVQRSKLINFIATYKNDEDFENREDCVAKALIGFIRESEEVEECHCMQVGKHVIFALRRSDVKLLQLFMKYGVLPLSLDRRDEKNEIMRTLKRFYFHLIGVEQVSGDRMMDREEIIAASDIRAESYYREASSLDSEGHMRLMQQLLGVEAILKKQRGDATYQEYAECVRIYFRAIPSPFLSTTEIGSLLYKLGSPKPLFIESLCHVFNEVFPESLGTPHAPSGELPLGRRMMIVEVVVLLVESRVIQRSQYGRYNKIFSVLQQ